jgi:UDP-3-O-[3-hydroxymyristoyl] glucosamine N-acyltransferase
LKKIDLIGNASIKQENNVSEGYHFVYNPITEEMSVSGNTKTIAITEDGKQLTIHSDYQQYNKKQNSYIGNGAIIGSDCFFHAGVNIGDRVKVGNKVILHHGVSLGADGFSFVTESPNNIEQARQDGEIKERGEQVIFKIPSIGSVIIGDNVEIGANACIDRGTIEDTIIGENTKIDDLVMIGHNCRVGKGCMIVSQVGIAGSCVIGDRVVIAGQAGLADHITIGDDTIITAKAGVTKSFPEKSIIIGIPAVPRKEFIKQLKTIKDAGNYINKFKKYEPILSSFLEEQQMETV